MDPIVSLTSSYSVDWDAFKAFDSDTTESSTTKIEASIENDFTCQFCETPTLIFEEGSHVCTKCGIVQKKELSMEAEYRFYGESDNKGSDPSRTGMATNDLIPEASLGTMLGSKGMDYNFRKIAKYNTWNSMNHRERSLWKVCTKISTIGKAHGIPTSIIDRANHIYKKIREVSICRGINKEGVIAACMFMACKDEGVPRSNKEIANMFGLELEDMTRGLKKFRDVWRQCHVSEYEQISKETSNPLHFIDRFTSNLLLPIEIKYIAEFVAVRAIQLGLDNNAPSIAAGAIYITCVYLKQPITKKQVAHACLISEVTIAKCFKRINEYRYKIFPKVIVDKHVATSSK